jgi:hypothetical protein
MTASHFGSSTGTGGHLLAKLAHVYTNLSVEGGILSILSVGVCVGDP